MNKPILFIFSGLPAVGKSTLAACVASEFCASYLRIDTIEQGVRELCRINVEGEGYRLAYRIAADNLKLNGNVVADCCNPIELTRREWEEVAIEHGCRFVHIEVICSDKTEHRKRAEQRIAAIPNLQLPTWDEIESREYHAWQKERIVIDTAGKTIGQCEIELKEKIADILSPKKEYEQTACSLKATMLKRLCHTKLGYGRINRKLGLHLSPQEIEDFVSGIIERTDEAHFRKRGKNYYITNDAEGIRITVNSFTYTVITADNI